MASAALLGLALIAWNLRISNRMENLHLRGYGTFFVQGHTHFVDANTARGGFPATPGLSMIDQMHVQFMLPQAQNGKKHYPIGIVHGCAACAL
jgi:hypothetical protein